MNNMPYYTIQFDMWQNVDVCRSDVHIQLIELSATGLYYIMSVWYVEECNMYPCQM